MKLLSVIPDYDLLFLFGFEIPATSVMFWKTWYDSVSDQSPNPHSFTAFQTKVFLLERVCLQSREDCMVIVEGCRVGEGHTNLSKQCLSKCFGALQENPNPGKWNIVCDNCWHGLSFGQWRENCEPRHGSSVREGQGKQSTRPSKRFICVFLAWHITKRGIK